MALNKKQRKRIEMHFTKRKTAEQQREQRIAAGVRKAGRRNRSRRAWSPDDDAKRMAAKAKRPATITRPKMVMVPLSPKA